MLHNKKNLDIEVLRGCAILFVVFHHRGWLITSTTSWFDKYFAFWSGVDLFLVISGFVIGRGLLSLKQESLGSQEYWANIIAFWIRRVWRIWPAAWVWMIFILMMSVITKSGEWGNFYPNFASVIGIVTATENIHSYACQQGATVCSGHAFGPYWSLSLEEQFYLIFPFALFLIKRRYLLLALTFGIFMQVFLSREVWSFMSAIRSDALLWGVLIAFSLEHPTLRSIAEPKFLGSSKVARFIFIFILLLLLCGVAGQQVVPFFYGVVGILSAVLVWAASYDKSYIMRDGFLRMFFVWVGSRSYAIYLTHVAAYSLAQELKAHFYDLFSSSQMGNWELVSLALVLIVIMAEGTFRIIEEPLRNKGKLISHQFLKKHLSPSLVENSPLA